ncbi:MAG: T9SS-dependent M36 family metallopeptidase [Bacteroidota bacterium]
MNLTLTFKKLILLGSMLLMIVGASAQDAQLKQVIQPYLNNYASANGFSKQDVSNWNVSHEYTAAHNGVQYVYIQQTYQGIPVFNGVANFALKNGRILHMGDRFKRNLSQRIQNTQPALDPASAIRAAANQLGIGQAGNLTQLESRSDGSILFSKGSISREDIPVMLMYQEGPEGELSLTWDLSIYQQDGKHWWSARIDARTGALLDKIDWVVSCAFSHEHHHTHGNHVHRMKASPNSTNSLAGEYRVYRYDVESPNHGVRTLEVEPADSSASPFGWHDIDGLSGAEYTITRGNNVHAYEDRNNSNTPGYSPDGGANLIFDFPLNFNLAPVANEDAAITNLFYHNNIIHDIFYFYGFTEAAGNFQQNNYGRGGIAGDYVEAQAQDGGGLNNANFATPPDGSNPRMQMYLWGTGGGGGDLLTINSPSTISGAYSGTEAGFGPGLPTTPITADIVLAVDGGTDTTDACDPLGNGPALAGKIALIFRGNCNFVDKVIAAQNAGAIAVIVANNVSPGTITMGGNNPAITIPSIMISQADGNTIKAQLDAGSTVNGTLENSFGGNPNDIDGDFDNGIVMHEYGHGISIRLTGGAGNSGCLSNAEQMGEGWSDYFALILSFDTAVSDRGIGTFASNQPTTGGGIRPTVYSPNTSINGSTYGTSNSAGISQPHGIGYVWCTMLWDMTLALVDQYGYDPDIYNGTGGNNIALQLVMDGLALQPCGPGFVDGRDAIMMADSINYGGANSCLLWEVFAARGLGFSADQGDPSNRSDQTEAFDINPNCLIPTAPPIAGFGFETVSICGNRVNFTDTSLDLPREWRWDFGDGAVDSVQNPSHTYNRSGFFVVTLIVTNPIGTDTVTQNVFVALPPGPVVSDETACLGSATQLFVNGTGGHTWYDVDGNTIGLGSSVLTGPLTSDTIFFVDQVLSGQVSNIGPVNGSFSTGGYHNNSFTGTLNFEANDELTILSAWIDAGSAGPRTISIWDNTNGSGNIVDQVTINVPAGAQRVNLGLTVPSAGTYSIGGSGVDLFRNNASANYPYEIAGLMSIFSSSATGANANNFYYYLYDIEVEGPDCQSDRAPVQVLMTEADFTYIEDTTTRTFSFADLSSNASSWEWAFGDGNSSTQQNPIHTYATPGKYEVTLLVNGQCFFKDSVEANIIASSQGLAPNLQVDLLPNPASEQAWLNFSRTLDQSINMKLVNLEGKEVQRSVIEAGTTSVPLDLKNLSSGIYFIQLNSKEGFEALRLIVNP